MLAPCCPPVPALSLGTLDPCAGVRLPIPFHVGTTPGLGDLRTLNKMFLPQSFPDGFGVQGSLPAGESWQSPL